MKIIRLQHVTSIFDITDEYHEKYEQDYLFSGYHLNLDEEYGELILNERNKKTEVDTRAKTSTTD